MKPGTFLTTTIAIILGLSFFSSCKKKDNLPFNSNTETFKSDLFKQNLKTALSGARGYGFVITQNKVTADTAQAGLGNSSAAAGTKPFSIDDFINIASVTKTLTATTFQMFLRYRPELSMESQIGPWLPESWTIHDQIKKITFRQLLQHRSGIKSSRTAWSNLISVCANPLEGDTSWAYSNVNLALFRAMLPKMNNLQVYNIEMAKGASSFHQWMSERYVMIMQDNLFKKLGLQNRSCVPVAGKTVDMLNEAPYIIVAGANDDWTNFCGGGGFYLTTRDLSKIIMTLAQTEDFLTTAEKAKMDAGLFGWRKGVAVKYGTAYGHGGALVDDRDGDGTITPGEGGLQTLIMKFPNNVELALSINSIGTDWRDMYDIAAKAYDAAWVKQ